MLRALALLLRALAAPYLPAPWSLLGLAASVLAGDENLRHAELRSGV